MMVRRAWLVAVLFVLVVGLLGATGQMEAEGRADDGDDVITVTTVDNVGGSIRYYGGDTTESNAFTEYLREELGIDVEYLWIMQGSGSDYEQKLNLSVLSGEVPDYFGISNVTMYRDFAEAGHLLEVKPTFDRLANDYFKNRINVQDNVLWDATEVDGKNYSIPQPKFLYQDNKSLWIRQDWLDALDLEAPRTIEEMYEVARAFTFDDPDGNGQDDTTGFGFDNSIMSWMASLDPFFGAYGAMPGTWLKGIWVEGDDGELVYPLFEGDAKAALAELNTWYEEGIVNVDFVTQNEQALAQMVGAGTLGMYYGSPWNPDWPHPDTFNNVADAEWKSYPLPEGPNGDAKSFNTPIVGGPGRVFGSQFEHLDRIIEYFNTRFETIRTPGPGVLESEYALGKYFQVDDQGRVVPMPDREFQLAWSLNNPFRYTEMVEYYDQGWPDRLDEAFDEVPYEIYRDLQIFQNKPEYINALRNVVESADDAFTDQFQAAVPGPVHERVWGFLRDLEVETISKIIMGELPVSAFDDFEDEWREAGGEELAAEVNEWWSSIQ
ncbi:MAG: extracellular solute-binding protein [bacterium]